MTTEADSPPAYLDAFGMSLTVGFKLPGTCAAAAATRGFQVQLEPAAADELSPLHEQPRLLRNLQAYEGQPYAALQSPDGDLLFRYGQAALFHLSPDHRVLRCAFSDPEDRSWQRVLLDTVLWSVSLETGFQLLHASAVKTSAGVVLLAGRRGGGKTSLAAEFLRRGASLFSDDIVALAKRQGGILAHPGPPLINLPHALDPDAIDAQAVLADYGDERWVQVGGERPAASQPRAVVVINRADGLPFRCETVPATSVTLLPFAITLPHLSTNTKPLFEAFSDLVSTTPVLRLDADPAVPTTRLADRVQACIARC